MLRRGVILVLLLAAIAVPASAVEESTPTTVDDLIILFNVGDVAADFIVVVDTSGSSGMIAMPIEIEIIRDEDGDQKVVVRPRRIL